MVCLRQLNDRVDNRRLDYSRHFIFRKYGGCEKAAAIFCLDQPKKSIVFNRTH